MPTYIADVVEQMGDDVARRCYWDWGPWSDLARVWRPLHKPPPPATHITFKARAGHGLYHVTSQHIPGYVVL